MDANTDDDEEQKILYLITMKYPSGGVLDKIVPNIWDLLDRSSTTRPLMRGQSSSVG